MLSLRQRFGDRRRKKIDFIVPRQVGEIQALVHEMHCRVQRLKPSLEFPHSCC